MPKIMTNYEAGLLPSCTCLIVIHNLLCGQTQAGKVTQSLTWMTDVTACAIFFAVRHLKTFIHTVSFEINGENTKELTYKPVAQMDSQRQWRLLHFQRYKEFIDSAILPQPADLLLNGPQDSKKLTEQKPQNSPPQPLDVSKPTLPQSLFHMTK